MADKRIIELANEKLVLADGDMTIVDSESGTYKYDLNRLAKKTITDSTLSVEGKPADAKAVGDALANVDVDTVNNARQLLSESYVLDQEPYLFRASGGEGADRVEECLVGGSVGWNQLGRYGGRRGTKPCWGVADADVVAESDTSITMSSVNASYWHEIPSGHKLFLSADVSQESASANNFQVNFGGNIITTGIKLGTTVQHFAVIGQQNGASYQDLYFYPNGASGGFVANWTVANLQLIDLTTLFGSTIADYIFSLEQSTAGAGVAFFRKYFPEDFYEYSAPTLRHVEGVSAKQIRDADDNVKAIYPLDSTLMLRGIPKLADGKMYFDGDRYLPSGQVERNTILRAYQSSDESLANAITDGTNTVVYSANASTETTTPYTALQTLDPYGTEEYVSTGIVPVGHESHYLENLRAKIEGLPKDFSTLIAPTEATYKATRNYTSGSLLIVDNILYKATSNIANGATITPNTNCTATTLAAVIAALA